jgi:iron complex outermembrane receptor protein
VFGGRQQHYDQYATQVLQTLLRDSNGDQFIPAGVVYQPTEAWSLYANYSRSFVPNTDTDDQGNTFDPEEGVSREVGPSSRRRTRSMSTWPCSISSKRTW